MQFLQKIFFIPNTLPLHGGVVIIPETKILQSELSASYFQAGAEAGDQELGTRHQALFSLSEQDRCTGYWWAE